MTGQQCDPHTITSEEKQNDINLDEATKELCLKMANAEFVMRPYQLCYAAAGKYVRYMLSYMLTSACSQSWELEKSFASSLTRMQAVDAFQHLSSG